MPAGLEVAVAEGLADGIDIFEIEQFVALNLYEMGEFAAAGRRTVAGDPVARCNGIVEDVETDPVLKIEIRK